MSLQPWLHKPLWVVSEQEKRGAGSVEPHLNLFDLVAIGVGGTIGSGVFVLAGYIARNYAGPATTVSFAISGVASFCDAICFAELAGRLPAAGSTYTYAYVALGELPAVIAAACLSLEYAISGAAVSRSWGAKVVIWLTDQFDVTEASKYLEPGYSFNPMAFLLSCICASILVKGIGESKFTTNLFSSLKVALCFLLIVGGLYYFNADNLIPFSPMGSTGILHGATECFFAYIGFDEACVIAGESLHPHRDMPRAVIITLVLCTAVYILAVFALTGMQASDEINGTSAFAIAFQHNGANVLAQITSAGVLTTLPVVVLVSLQSQPRLFQAMARDGLMPSAFARVDTDGNLRFGALTSGIGMICLASFLPFHYFNDLISGGMLVAYSMTNCCVVMLRCESPATRPHLLLRLLFAFNILSFIMGLVFKLGSLTLNIVSAVILLGVFVYMRWQCPLSNNWGGSVLRQEQSNPDSISYFATPLVPYLPCLGMFVNNYLIAQLDGWGLFLLFLYIGIAASLYGGAFFWCNQEDHSIGWKNATAYEEIPDAVVVANGESQCPEDQEAMTEKNHLGESNGILS